MPSADVPSAPVPADVAEASRTAKIAAQEGRERAETRADKDRTMIAVNIMGVYAGSLVLIAVLLMVRGFANRDAWADVTKDVADLIKTTVLPIVTPMLGYYFGTSGRA